MGKQQYSFACVCQFNAHHNQQHLFPEKREMDRLQKHRHDCELMLSNPNSSEEESYINSALYAQETIETLYLSQQKTRSNPTFSKQQCCVMSMSVCLSAERANMHMSVCD